ncbi:threonine ammonia-lyase [Oharaeibacter diazotrophicus]|uniref:Threonine dehydratase n=1 Tax=Oharaeibacter diazotrophicus TaxID=1920512 RepID=A0A4R6RM93_9HYPH|nr:threonine/serine dehydratase [Oharaeibacter diazotrophicus]TDP87680.1 threonine dehydratase [Oharaeibacter diazotrophicus]BBE74737.1 L-threonine dehydratase catabolic TdcB [Pleomorphomonas sp. SM30]GLS77119.1 serine/threonine dehydratase [Oharaeibacter diazotrophicus]
MTAAPSFADVRAAADRIHAEAVRTPLLPVTLPSGGLAFVKCENLQRTGSFKFRGAFNRLSMIPPEARAAGVVACSSGNHAQGVAEAARILGMPATIVMPKDAPATKVRRTRGFGAEVVLYDRHTEDREAIANAIAARTGATFVHPFDDAGVIAGQGTIGLEIAEDCAQRGLKPDAVLVCTSGGGLVAGIATALAELSPETAVHTVEPAGFDDYARSLAAGERLRNASLGGSVCDALMSNVPGAISFSVGTRRLSPGVVVTDDEALAAVAFAARELKLVVEPGGAVALAALLSGKVETAGRIVVAVLSGGNVDDAMLARALALTAPDA